MTVGFIGLGLMGGSLSLALKKYQIASRVIGYSPNMKYKDEILKLGLADELVSFEILKSQADVIILAIPVEAIIEYMPKFLDIDENTTIMDLGSTKELIVNHIPPKIRKNFVAAHPMTGTEKFGPSASIHNLYEGKTVVLCNLEDNAQIHAERALEIFDKIKMNIVRLDAKTHDIYACYMSHLPHAISFSLANSVMNRQNPEAIISLAAGGFKDMSRVAKSSPTMWSDIFKQNRNNLLDAIEVFEKELLYAKKLVQDEDYENLHKWMEKANTLHDIL